MDNYKLKGPVMQELGNGSLFNAVELLVRLGLDECLPLLEKLLARDDVECVGSNLFHLAIDGSNPILISKVIQRFAEFISREDLNWMIRWGPENPLKLASLNVLVNGLVFKRVTLSVEAISALGDLINHLVTLGYDLNGPQECPLIFYVLFHHLQHKTSILQTILQFDHLMLNVTNELGYTPIDFLLEKMNMPSICVYDRQLPPSFLETIQLLLSHGMDVSGVCIGPNFMYHKGSKVVIKMLYRAGAKISDDFFRSTRKCPRIYDSNDAFANEIRELKKWKDDFDRETGFTLKHISGVRVRKMLKCVGDRKILDVLPKRLKQDILKISSDLSERDGELDWGPGRSG